MSNLTFAHAHDHAVVSLNGDLDWDTAFSLVNTIDTMVKTYFYTTIEMVVSSPGGNTQALHYCLARLDRLANERVRLRARVLSFAGSAAAILVSSGDERLVEPGALLAWHGAQIRNEQQADARATAALASALTAADDRLIDRLVSRALATAKSERPAHRAERSDRWVLELLAEALRGKGETKVPKKIGRLARAVGSAVDRAVRDADRKALSNVYRRLFELDATVSAHLGATLRLVDRVGAAPAEKTVRPSVGGLVVPEWRVLYAPDGTVPRDVLTRHTLVLGKTGSCILPVVAAMAGAPRERLGAALIIDPKRELAQVLHRMAPERLHHVTVDNAVLKVMAGPRWSLDGDLGESRWLSAARRILCRVASFVPSTPAHVLMDHEVTNANTEFFNREGTSLAMTLLAFLLMLLDGRTPPPATWLQGDVEAFTWAEDLVERARAPDGPNALALLAWVLDGPLMSSPSSRRGILFSVEEGEATHAPPDEWLFTRLARAALEHVCTKPGEGRDLCGRIVDYWTPMVEVDRQYAGVRATAASVCSDFASPPVARTLYFGCEPGYRAAREGGSYEQNRGAVEIRWNNTASKLVFRSTDPEVADRVSELSPYRPGLPGVVRVRPVSTLAPGECYASLADGRFERRQLGHYRAEAPDEAGGRARPSPPGANRDPPPAVRVARSPPGPGPARNLPSFPLPRFAPPAPPSRRGTCSPPPSIC